VFLSLKKIEPVSDDFDIPQWHKAILDQRMDDKTEGYLNWETGQIETSKANNNSKSLPIIMCFR
jgi:hypothetical protein